MSDTTASFPVDFQTRAITGDDGYIVAEALYLAAKWIDEMPDKVRLVSDKRDILTHKNTAFPTGSRFSGRWTLPANQRPGRPDPRGACIS